MLVRQATIADVESYTRLLRDHGYNVEHGQLPPPPAFAVYEESGILNGCCALKRYSRKSAEVMKWVFPHSNGARRLWAKRLIGFHIEKAQEEYISELLAMASEEDSAVFEDLGFNTFRNEKFALVKSLAGLTFLPVLVPGGVLIRPAERREWKRIKELIATQIDLLVQEEELLPTWDEFYVAEVNGIVVGCSALDFFSIDIAEVRSVVVLEEYGGHGIGQALVASCINRALALGIKELLAITADRAAWFQKHFDFSTVRGSELALLKVLKNGNG